MVYRLNPVKEPVQEAFNAKPQSKSLVVADMKKTVGIALILILTASSALWIESTNAQSLPTPSVPEFTVKQVDRSYGVKPSPVTNPFTGEIITQPDYSVDKLTIEVTIKNQPFTPPISVDWNTTGLHYNVQAKCSYEDWSTTVYSDSSNKYVVPASTSESTVVTIDLGSPQGWDITLGSVVNIRVQAVAGNSYTVWSPGGGMVPIGDGFDLQTASSWSSTQTITVGEGTVTPEPTTTPPQSSTVPTETAPSRMSTSTPSQAVTQTDVAFWLSWEQIVIAVMAAAIAVLAAGLAVMWRKLPRK
jgi:hypothetical protein